MNALPISTLYASLLGLLFLALSVHVVRGRGAFRVNLGDGGHAVLNRRIRAHANFVEYVPILLILLGLLEASGLPAWSLHAFGATLLVSRLLHGIALGWTERWIPGRFYGTLLSFILLLTMALAGLYTALAGS